MEIVHSLLVCFCCDCGRVSTTAEIIIYLFLSRTSVPALLVPRTIFSTSRIFMIDNPGPLCLLSLLFDAPSKDTDLVIPCQFLCAYARHWSSPRNSRLSSTLNLQINPFLNDHHGILWF